LRNPILLTALLTAMLLSAPAAFAHGGEDHSHDAPAAQTTRPVAPRAVASTDEFEVVAVIDGGKLVFYIDRYADNAPVAGAKLEVDGAVKGVAAEAAPGTYVIDAPNLGIGRHALAIAIETAGTADLLSATLETAPPPSQAAVLPWWKRWLARESRPATPAATATAPAAPQRLAEGTLFVPKPAQRQLDLRTLVARQARLVASIELNGTVIADPGSGGRVQAPFAGSVRPGPQGMPAPGRRVARGELLAWLHPVASAIERGNQRAQLAELEAQLAIADGRVKRFEQLEGAVPRKEIDAAKIQRDALEKRRRFVAASIDSAEALRAPASGVLSATGHLVAGQIVDAREVLFEIVDPARLAVEALAYDPGLATNIAGASALVEGNVELELKFIGGGRQLREQALPLLFAIATRNAPVAVGQPVRVMARTAQGIEGIAVPRTALVKVGAGGTAADTAVWVHTEAERFAVRAVRTRPLDAGRVAVTDGLHDGDRVVVAGASLLGQVR
jgi:hypothetical protein